MSASRAPLDGVLIADFSRILAGPYATMLLGDLGATVVKVERPITGDDTRSWGPPYGADGATTYFTGINRNKLSIALDLASPADLAIARELAMKSDVLIENFRPNSLRDFGLDFETLHAAHPSLIYCSISGFGTQAGAAWPGYDLLVQAMGGLMSITGLTEPTKVGVAVVDVLAGLHCVVGILAALRQRDQTNLGQLVEVDLLSSLLSGLVNQSAAFVQAGEIAGLLGNAHPSIAPYEVYQASDRQMVIAVGNDNQFGNLVDALGRPELATDSRFATNSSRVGNRVALNQILSDVFRTRPAEDWIQLLAVAQVPCGLINDLSQAFALAERLGLEPVRAISLKPPRTASDATLPPDATLSQAPTQHLGQAPTQDSSRAPARQAATAGAAHSRHEVAHPIKFSESEITYRRPAPDLDADRDEIIRMLETRG